MTYEILKGSAQFKYGFIDYNQMSEWFQKNPNIIGISFVGRSNVGKSSLINTIFGNRTAKTSKTPGRTRVINIFTFKLSHNKSEQDLPLFYLFDLPGYGHAKISKELRQQWDKLMEAFFYNCSNNVKMINLQDARHPNQTSDQFFHNFFKQFSFKTSLVINKIDKLKTQKEKNELKKKGPELYHDYKWVEDIFYVSAEKRTGIKELHQSIVSFLLEHNNFNVESTHSQD